MNPAGEGYYKVAEFCEQGTELVINKPYFNTKDRNILLK